MQQPTEYHQQFIQSAYCLFGEFHGSKFAACGDRGHFYLDKQNTSIYMCKQQTLRERVLKRSFIRQKFHT